MKPEILIVAAMTEESCGLFEQLGHEVLYTGIGKLNAAIRLTRKLHRKPLPVAILNLGTAGSFMCEPRSVVRVDKFIERDFDFKGLSKPIETRNITSHPDSVTCGSGDSFLLREHLQNSWLPFTIADMEGYALAKVCGMYSVPFFSLKCISDDGSTDDWQKNLGIAAKLLAEAAAPVIAELERMYA